MNRPVERMQSSTPVFFSPRNQAIVETTLINEFETRERGPLNPRYVERLQKTISHYSTEIYSAHNDKPLQALNRELIRVCAQDFGTYITKQKKTQITNGGGTHITQLAHSTAHPAVNSQSMRDVKPASSSGTSLSFSTAPGSLFDSQISSDKSMDGGMSLDNLFQDTSTRYDFMQKARQDQKEVPPPAPDFRISLDEDGPSPAELFEKAKKMREADAMNMAKFVNADDAFRKGQNQQNRDIDAILMDKQQTVQNNTPKDDPLLPIMPDRRDILFGNSDATSSAVDTNFPLMTFEERMPNSNPTIVRPTVYSATENSLQQNVVIRDENILSYREIENNLIVYSIDRNWLQNTKENRYSFSINFDPANNTRGDFAMSPAVQNRFRNIVRIEFVKAVIPRENLDITLGYISGEGYKPNYLLKPDTYPYLILNIDEFNSNDFGSDNVLDRSFAVLQADSDFGDDASGQSRFNVFVPKFMKCQKIFYPSPLSNLFKMTINLLRPNGSLVSNTQDSYDISSVYGGTTTPGGNIYNISQFFNHINNVPNYYFIETKSYFNSKLFLTSDIVQIANYSYTLDSTYTLYPYLREFGNWMNDPAGHQVVGVGCISGSTYLGDKPNAVGYANVIIIPARMQDPTKGGIGVDPFTTSDINTGFTTGADNLSVPCRLINTMHQTQLVFRVITREKDASPELRPDNV
jgi:hypothetical protein